MSTTQTAPATSQPAPGQQAPVRTRTFVQALNEALDIAMERDPEVFLLGEDIGVMGGDFGVTRNLFTKYGKERVRDTPLSEAAIIGTSVGAAMVGMRPVAEIMFADFLGECFDQIVNNAAKMHYMFDGQFKAPIVVRTACGGGFGGGPHHSQSVEGWFLNVPGLVIVAPATAADAKGLLLASIEDDNPVLFLEHKALYRIKGDVPEGYYTTPLRKAAVARSGKDVTIVASMKMTHEALAAAADLAGEGIEAEVIDLRTIRPYDAETMLESVRKTGRAVVVAEAPRLGGLAAELSATIAEECFHDLKGPVQRVGGLDAPIPFSVVLEKFILPGKEQILAATRAALAQVP
ncbi:MAG: alpha-ketoacid dehydrogenase subunit beta [Caldilineaceae bacterium]